MNKEKKVLILANSGGFFSFLLSDIDLLMEKGYTVRAAANGRNHVWQDTADALAERSVKMMQVDFEGRRPLSRSNFTAYRQVRGILREESFDLIHCHTPVVGLIARIVARKYRKKGTKVLYTTHGFAFTKHSSWKQRMIYHAVEALGSLMCDGMITINQEDFASARKMYCKNVFYIPGVGVDINKYHKVHIDREAYRKSLNIEPDKIMVLAVGEISARKNHRIVVEAIGKIAEKEHYVFVVCGSGADSDEGQKLQKLAVELDVDLRLLGFRHDIPQIMHCSDIGAIPSIREGLGLAGIQSLCAEVPVIGSNVQGIRDYITDGENGFLCDPFDAEAFAEKIQQLSSAELRGKLAENCFRYAEKFDLAISRKRREEIYSIILEWPADHCSGYTAAVVQEC